MKSYTYKISALGATFVAAYVNGAVISDRLVTRQTGYLSDSTIEKAPVHSIVDLPPKYPHAVHKRIRYGPFTVPGSQEPSIGQVSDKEADKLGSLAFIARTESFCGGDCSILYGVGIPEFENGTAISAVGSSIYNHHVFVRNLNRLVSHHICPSDPNPVGQSPGTVINSQTDREVTVYTSSDAKVKTGYAIKATDELDLLAEFMNYRTEKQRITIAFDFEYIPGKPQGYLHSQQMMFSATPCDQLGFNVPSKQYSITSNKWKAPVDMTLINARGHQHDGHGVGMSIFVNGKLVCNSTPTYAKVRSHGGNEGEHYGIQEMSLCQPYTQLKEGDILTIKSDYDIEKYPQRQGNAGHMESVAAMLSVVFGLPPDFDVSRL